MRYAPRPYQVAAIESVRDSIRRGNRSMILLAPVGSGKTTCAAEIIKGAVAKGSRVVFVAHRLELIEQCASKLDDLGIDNGILKAGHSKRRPWSPVQVASVQTLVRRNMPKADVVFFDECHLSLSASWRKVAENYRGAILIGLTATAARMDNQPLSDLYSDIVKVATVQDLVDSGYLIAPTVYAPHRPDLAGVRIRAGDYDARQLAEAMDKRELVGDLVEWWERLAKGRRTVVFASSVEHSKHIVERFCAAGHRAKHLDGTMNETDRRAILSGVANGDVDIVSNVAVLCEGYDAPALSCCVMARSTLSTTLFRQQIGRIMRTHPGKGDALLLDHAGNTFRHGFATDEIEYSLTADIAAKQPPAVTVCKLCFAVRPVGPGTCPECGERPPAALVPKPRSAPEQVDGKLVQLTPDGRPYCADCGSDNTERVERASLGRFAFILKCHGCGQEKIETDKLRAATASMAEKREEFARLDSIRERKGYKSGWASHRYRAVFGCWPRGVANNDREVANGNRETRTNYRAEATQQQARQV